MSHPPDYGNLVMNAITTVNEALSCLYHNLLWRPWLQVTCAHR